MDCVFRGGGARSGPEAGPAYQLVGLSKVGVGDVQLFSGNPIDGRIVKEDLVRERTNNHKVCEGGWRALLTVQSACSMRRLMVSIEL